MDNYFFNFEDDRLAAIYNLGGNEALYEKYLARFRKEYADKAEEIHALIVSGDTAEASRISHSVKGLSATLGLRKISMISADLEGLINKGPDGDNDTVFASRLKELISSLSDALEESCS